MSKAYQHIKIIVNPIYGSGRGLQKGIALGRFLSVAGIGFDGEVTRLMQHARMKSIHVYSYLLPLWQTLRDYSLPSFSLAIDDQTIDVKATSVVIGNVKNYGGYFSITHRAEADDGWLDICVFPGKSGKDYLRYLVGAILRRPTIFSDVTYYRGKKVEIQSSHPVPIEVDGDFIGYTPFVCEVVPKSAFLLLSSPGPRVKRFVPKHRELGRMKR